MSRQVAHPARRYRRVLMDPPAHRRSPRVHTTLRPRRRASGASGLDRIVGTITAIGSYDTMPSNRGRGATMGPPACPSSLLPPVPSWLFAGINCELARLE